MPTICCHKTRCGYNKDMECLCSHVQFTDSGCAAFIPKEEFARREIEVRCYPYNLDAPVVLICRSNVPELAKELQRYGFRRDREPLHGLFGFTGTREPRAFVWALQADFDGLESILDALKADGFTVDDRISKDEKAMWEKERFYSGMTREQKAERLLKLHPPKKPRAIEGGYWNGKVYGQGGIYGRGSIYVSGKKISLSCEEIDELHRYKSRLAAYEEEKRNLTLF